MVILIVILQVVIILEPFSKEEILDKNNTELIAFQNKIDSLKLVEIENRKPKIYPFNPNYITDFKGAQLGMSLEEIDRLHVFRKSNRFVNSKEDFQKVTKISDSLLMRISSYFKFPDWVVKRNKQKQIRQSKNVSKFNGTNNFIAPNKLSTTDLNKATSEDFSSVKGIGASSSERIIKYRSKLQGFSYPNQLYEVWNLKKEAADKLLAVFKIVKKPIIKKINVNTAEFKQLLKNPYIDYELCKKIFNYRDEVAELQKISELKNIEGFPLDKYDRIVLYLLAE